VIVAGEEAEVTKDTIIVINPGLDHKLVNTGQESFKVLWIFTPPGAENMLLNQQRNSI